MHNKYFRINKITIKENLIKIEFKKKEKPLGSNLD